MNKQLQYTYLSRSEMLSKLEQSGIQSSLYHVDKLLKKLGLGRRKMAKTGTFKQVQGRNEQFERIEALLAHAREAGHIIISVDTKKKELLGHLYRPGKNYCNTAQVCYDHDFASQATGKVVPYGIYDVQLNEGYMFLGQSADTADFAVDCLYEYLKYYAAKRYPQAKQVLVLCDSGGSNGYRNYRFKEMIQWLADKMDLQIRIAHYPSYCSKYNPCDHKLFPHITRALSGVMLDSVQTIRNLIKSRAKTKQGLRVFVRQMKNEYQTKVKATKEFLKDYPIVHDEVLPQWNYVAVPSF